MHSPGKLRGKSIFQANVISVCSAGIRLYDSGNCWHFSQAQGNEFYLLGFGAIHEDKLEKALTELADAVFDIKEKLIM